MTSPAIARAVAEQEDALVEAMFSATNRALPTPEADVRQFLRGFLRLLGAAAAGDTGPRDAYLSTVIPALKEGGMPLWIIMDGMVRVSVAAGATLPREELPWLATFVGDYTKALLERWDAG